MANGLNTLLQALLGGAAGGFEGYAKGQYAKQEKEEREAERKRLQDQFAQQMAQTQRTFDAQRDNESYGRAKDVYSLVSPDTDLTTSPLLKEFEKYNLPTTKTPAVSAPKLSDSLTLPSMPSSTPPLGIGGAASTPMTGGKYDPTAPEGDAAPAASGSIPKPLPVGGPMTVATPTYGLGAPGKVTRAETRQESQQRIAREGKIAAYKGALTTLGKDPLSRSILEHSIKSLEAGGDANITESELLAMQRASEPPKPPASAQADFDFINSFRIVNKKDFDPTTATEAERQAAVDHVNKTKLQGQRAPAGSGGFELSAPTTPVDPDSQDLMGHTGLSAAGFFAVTGQMAQLSRDQATRNAALAEMQRWAADKGIDISSFRSRYKAVNDALQTNIERQNNIFTAQDELIGDIESLSTAAAKAGLDDVTAANKAKLWLQGQLNEPGFADYAFALEAMVSDLARYNAASSGRPADQSDMTSARSVLQRGIAKGGLTGIKDSLARSVTNVSAATEKAVERTRKQLWDLFGVGGKYKPSKTAGGGTPAGGGTIELEIGPDGKLRPKGGG